MGAAVSESRSRMSVGGSVDIRLLVAEHGVSPAGGLNGGVGLFETVAIGPN
jgi:hypothetical protein